MAKMSRSSWLVLVIASLTGPGSWHSPLNGHTSESSIPSEPPVPPASCEALASLTLPGATITLARMVDAGAFTPPAPTGGATPPAASIAGVPRPARVLPCGRDAEAVQRLRHQDRSVDAGRGLERKVPGRRQRRVQRSDRLSRHGSRARTRLRDELHRHRARRRQRELRARTPGEGDRLRLARGPRDDRGVEEDHRGLLRRRPEVLVLEWLFGRRTPGR